MQRRHTCNLLKRVCSIKKALGTSTYVFTYIFLNSLYTTVEIIVSKTVGFVAIKNDIESNGAQFHKWNVFIHQFEIANDRGISTLISNRRQYFVGTKAAGKRRITAQIKLFCKGTLNVRIRTGTNT